MERRRFLMLAYWLLAACTPPARSESSVAEAARPLTPEPRYVFGTVTYHERADPPADAEVRVWLLDVSNGAEAAEVVASTRLRNLGGAPVAFALRYEPDKVHEDRLYAVRADIASRGRTIFASRKDHPVLTRGNPDRVDIVVAPMQDDT